MFIITEHEAFMPNPSFSELVDIEKIRHLLEAQYRITGILSALLDTEENILVAVGWQDICTRFHRANPGSCRRCRESDAFIKSHLHDFSEGYLDYRCENGLRDVAMPIMIGGEHVATLFTGQFFYNDDKPDIEFFRAQAMEFGFDVDSYLAALAQVPFCSREHIRNVMDYYRNLVTIMAELGLKNLGLTKEVKHRKEAEESLLESREYLDSIMNTIPDPIFVKDREHRYILANDVACSTIGRSRAEVIGSTDYDLFPKAQAEIIWGQDNLAFESDTVHINEEEITDARGERRVVLAKKSLYRDHSGNKFIVGIIRDIHELKQKELELESRVAARTSELAALNAELMREIEERKKAEEEIKVRQRQLEELNQTLKIRVEEEVADNRAKDVMLIQQNRQAALGEMLDHIAHQWKQPINTVALIVQDLEMADACGELTHDYLKGGVHKILALLEHMGQTADVFRDFYKPEKELIVFRLKDAIDMAVGFIAPALRMHSIAVELDVDPGLVALGHPREFAQVLLNLVGNARDALAERKAESPRITLRAFSSEGKAVVTVTDNAGGIAAADLDKIFEPYFTTRKASGGTGVGLYMSKNIIEKSMGGTLHVANVGAGAEFTVEIPVA